MRSGDPYFVVEFFSVQLSWRVKKCVRDDYWLVLMEYRVIIVKLE